MAEVCLLDAFMETIKKADSDGVVLTPQELRQQQYGLPLRHYAQQYLFGSTGLRLRVFHSIAGVPASCKSPLLFDLMGHICADASHGGLGGIGFLYELEDKISPTLLNGILEQYGDILGRSFKVVKDQTIGDALKHITTRILPTYTKVFKKRDMALVIGLDSIGGAASQDTVEKIKKEGSTGKGYYDKPHLIKYFCENIGKVLEDIPAVFICVNQEKEQAASTPYGPPQKKITGGVSQIFKDGHMISANFKTLASGDGKVITLRTTKTSFSDSRKIEVTFRWNKYGDYNHHFEWALASANCIASPEKGVGEIRDIADVKVSDQGLVTCPQLGCKSVRPDEFETALFDPSNAAVLSALYDYQKIEQIKDLEAYAAHIKGTEQETVETGTDDNQPTDAPVETQPAPVKRRGRRPAGPKLSDIVGGEDTNG